MMTAKMRGFVLLGTIVATGCTGGMGLARTEVTATLTGQQQTPGPADMDGTGTARIRLDAGNGRLCWEVAARQIGRATSASIHRGAAGSIGPALVTLTAPDAGGRSAGCATAAAELVREMALQAHQFYIVVADEAHPQGAIRGQLTGGIIPPAVRRPPVRR